LEGIKETTIKKGVTKLPQKLLMDDETENTCVWDRPYARRSTCSGM